jgi:hypothetical protein
LRCKDLALLRLAALLTALTTLLTALLAALARVLRLLAAALAGAALLVLLVLLFLVIRIIGHELLLGLILPAMENAPLHASFRRTSPLLACGERRLSGFARIVNSEAAG